MNLAPVLSAEAWTLLASIHEHSQGGPSAPQPDGTSADAYQLLLLYGLIERSDQGTWAITQLGEVALYRHEEADAGGGTLPELSGQAWLLLGLLHREVDGGPRASAATEFADAYSELLDHGLVRSREITRKGYLLMTRRYLGGE